MAVTTHAYSAKVDQQLAEALYDLGQQGEAMTYYRPCFELAEGQEPTPPDKFSHNDLGGSVFPVSLGCEGNAGGLPLLPGRL